MTTASRSILPNHFVPAGPLWPAFLYKSRGPDVPAALPTAGEGELISARATASLSVSLAADNHAVLPLVFSDGLYQAPGKDPPVSSGHILSSTFKLLPLG